MLYLVPKKTGVILLSTRGPGALTRHLAGLGIHRPRATLDQVNACSWGASLRGDDALRILGDATRRPQLIERVTWARAFAVLFDAACAHARRKNFRRSFQVANAAAPGAPVGAGVAHSIADLLNDLRFHEPRPPARGEQTR